MIIFNFFRKVREITQNEVIGYLILVIISFSIGTTLFWFAEFDRNPDVNNFVDVAWWWVISTSTVGYGDIVPITVVGRLVGIVTVIQGIYMYTNFITVVSSAIHRKLNGRKLGTEKYKFENHIVICEFTALADELLEEIACYPELNKKKVVIVSDLIELNPYKDKYFVKGTPFSPDALSNASIENASHIFIFTNSRFSNPDLKSYHLASRIRRISPNSEIHIELFDSNKRILNKIGGNIKVIESEKAVKQLLEEGKFDIEIGS